MDYIIYLQIKTHIILCPLYSKTSENSKQCSSLALNVNISYFIIFDFQPTNLPSHSDTGLIEIHTIRLFLQCNMCIGAKSALSWIDQFQNTASEWFEHYRYSFINRSGVSFLSFLIWFSQMYLNELNKAFKAQTLCEISHIFSDVFQDSA